jgi:hypothetical protein
MPVDHQQKLIFIHVPRTGGTTILTLLGLWKPERSADLQTLFGDLGPLDLQHLTLAQVRQFLTPAEFAAYFKFAFVRNPWDRAVSAALWRARFRDEGVRDLRDYVDWAEGVNRRGPRRPSDIHALPQSAFVMDAGGRIGVTSIGRFERYAEDLAAILGRFRKIRDPLPHKLQHPDRRHYRSYYDGGLKARVAALYAEDVARFAYAF